MLARLVDFIRNLFVPQPVHLAIVRKYQDAQGHNVGELYMEQTIKRKHDELRGYTMIGVSLDSFSLDLLGLYEGASDWLDTRNDFLAPMEPNTIRVGALDPKDNDEVRRMIAKLPKRAMRVVVQNRFIEHVLDKPC